MCDWTEVRWFVYSSPKGDRVLERELPPAHLRPGEVLAATIDGVSQRAVENCLRRGMKPADITPYLAKAAQQQYERSAADRAPNRYRDWLEDLKRRRSP